jgi:phthalate 4,5-dioxygenase reductase subunit
MSMIAEKGPVRSESLVETKSAPNDSGLMALRVAHKREIAHGIFLFELTGDDTALPPFTAGSHLLVRTPSGQERRYSLCNAPSETGRYVIAVKRDADGAGGSISMADAVSIDDQLTVSLPQNYFPLSDEARSHLLIAGGIGITPILSMARHLVETGSDLRLIYCARSPSLAAFREKLSAAPFADRTLIHFDDGDPTKSLNLAPLLAKRPDGAHVYCCGPRPLMQAVREGTKHWPHPAVHFEDFGSSKSTDRDGERPFRVRLARSGRLLEVPPGVSILEALRRQGCDAPCSCESGTCGTCRTGLISGTADHRDFVLDESEQASSIMICVSRAVSDELVLDL